MKRKLLFFGILIVLLAICWKLFYQSFNEKQIHQDADRILIIDKKRLQNKVIWEFITTPSLWDISFEDSDEKWSWKNSGLKIEDYVCFFYLEKGYYWSTEITNKDDFEKTIHHLDFKEERIDDDFVRFFSEKDKIEGIQYEDKILWSRATEKEKTIKVAKELFIEKKYFDKNKMERVLSKMNEGSVWIKENQFLKNNTWFDITLNDTIIKIQSDFQLNEKYKTEEQQFIYDTTSWINLNYSFHGNEENLIKNSWKKKLNKWMGFSIDSILMTRPKTLSFSLQKMKSRVDSAITYEFDDNFNEIKVIQENKVNEPSFLLNLEGNSNNLVLDYLKKKKIVDSQNIFINIPLVKTKAITSPKSFQLISENYQKEVVSDSIKAVLFATINFNQIDSSYYFDDKNAKIWNQGITKIKKATLKVNDKKSKLTFDLSIQTKENLILNFLK